MTNLLFSICLSAALSLTSLAIVLTRVTPLTNPLQAVPALFVSLFLSVSSVCTLIFLGAWTSITHQKYTPSQRMRFAIREGIFSGSMTGIIFLFHLLHLLNWWIALLIFAIFFLIELAMLQ